MRKFTKMIENDMKKWECQQDIIGAQENSWGNNGNMQKNMTEQHLQENVNRNAASRGMCDEDIA